MISKIYSLSVEGIHGRIIEVEVDIASWLPSFTIVGLADTAIQESRERIRSAIKNSGFTFPTRRITVNLAPADIRKSGPAFDLAITLWILSGEFEWKNELLTGSIFLWELALDGRLREIHGILPSVITAREQWYKYVFIPKGNENEARLIPGIACIPIENLSDAVAIVSGEKPMSDFTNEPLKSDKLDKMRHRKKSIDFSSIIGQEQAKRALLIAAAGGHNVFMEGPPGSGKTMLAHALWGILPDMDIGETIEVSKIYSVAGMLKKDTPLVVDRPFRSVHHTASTISIIGGWRDARPGEISLAHKWALFLDEFLEFESRLIETLRQPLEDGCITINRVNASYTYPSKFMLIGAFNPCPCGFLWDNEKTCTCSQGQVERYRRKLSGPMLDRIDLYIRVPRVTRTDLDNKKNSRQTSKELKEFVEKARNIQNLRFHGLKNSNSEMDNEDIDQHCQLEAEEDKFLKNATSRLDLSTRAYFRVLRLARTIADLEGSEKIKLPHLAEALSYRN